MKVEPKCEKKIVENRKILDKKFPKIPNKFRKLIKNYKKMN